MKKEKINGKPAYEQMLDELKILKTLKHPNVIYLKEIID